MVAREVLQLEPVTIDLSVWVAFRLDNPEIDATNVELVLVLGATVEAAYSVLAIHYHRSLSLTFSVVARAFVIQLRMFAAVWERDSAFRNLSVIRWCSLHNLPRPGKILEAFEILAVVSVVVLVS